MNGIMIHPHPTLPHQGGGNLGYSFLVTSTLKVILSEAKNLMFWLRFFVAFGSSE